MACFNPCFIGTYSFTKGNKRTISRSRLVLILVLLELILLPDFCFSETYEITCFNPCFIGTYSFTFSIS